MTGQPRQAAGDGKMAESSVPCPKEIPVPLVSMRRWRRCRATRRTATVRKFLNANRSAFDPRDYLKPAREAAKVICKARYEQFGCAGMASKIKPVALGSIAAKYKSGELAQIVN
jgi:hypothetical protein